VADSNRGKSLVQWVKIDKKSIETTAGWFFEHSENMKIIWNDSFQQMESHKGHFPVTSHHKPDRFGL